MNKPHVEQHDGFVRITNVPESLYVPVQGIRAVAVDGAEVLLRQGEYYIADGRLLIKCPLCRMDNLAPKGFKFKTANWWQQLLGIKKGLFTAKMQCWLCFYGFYASNGELWVTNEPIKA